MDAQLSTATICGVKGLNNFKRSGRRGVGCAEGRGGVNKLAVCDGVTVG